VLLRLLPILGITFIDILGFSILIPLMPYFVKSFHAPDVAVGAVFATYSLCQLIAGPVWGNVSDRIGRKMVLIVSQAGATVAWGLLAAATSIPLVFASRALEGLSGGNIGVTQAYVGDLVEPKQRGTAFAYVGAAFSAGFVFGPAAGGWLQQYGYAVPFALAALLQLITLVLTVVLLPESRGRTPADAPSPFKPGDIFRSFGDRRIAPVLWLRLVYTLAMYGWFSSMALVLHAQLGWNVTETSYVFAAFGLLQVVLQLTVVGRVVERLGNRAATNTGFAFCLAAFALVPFVHAFAAAVALIVLFGIGLSLNNAAFPALASESAAEDRRGTVLGVFSGLDSFAGFVMPPVVTGVLGAFGVPPAAAIMVSLVAVALLMGLVQARGVPPAPAAVATD
jgi:DHA1 family tetracycline resistance protein-like MFS transporter